VVTRDEWGFEIGKAVSVRDGRDVLLVSTGVMLGGGRQPPISWPPKGFLAHPSLPDREAIRHRSAAAARR